VKILVNCNEYLPTFSDVPDQLDQTLESSGIYSDSEIYHYQNPPRTPRTTFRDPNGRIRSLITRSSSAERRRDFLFTQSCQIESVSVYLNKEKPVKRSTRSRDCYDIRVQMGNQNSTVGKIRKNTIDKIPSLKHDRPVVPDADKELEVVSITPQHTMSSQACQVPNTFRPMSPGPTDVVVTTQIPQAHKPLMPLPSNQGNKFLTTQTPQTSRPSNPFTSVSSKVVPTTQIPQTTRSTNPFSSNRVSGYASSQVVPTTQIPQSTRSTNPFSSNAGYASSQIILTTQISQTCGNTASLSNNHSNNDSDGTRSYGSSEIGPSHAGWSKHGYASSHIGGYTSRGNHRCAPLQIGPTSRLATIPMTTEDDGSFVLMPNLNRSPPKKAYSVIATPSSNYNQRLSVYDGHPRTESNTSFGMSCDRSSTNSYTANLKSHSDICYDICNTFWRPQLTFNPYIHGDEVVDFGSLWPDQNMLKGLLEEAYQATSLRRSVLDICKLVLRCGPMRVLQTLVTLRIIGKWCSTVIFGAVPGRDSEVCTPLYF
jgi:hypothetical protein